MWACLQLSLWAAEYAAPAFLTPNGSLCLLFYWCSTYLRVCVRACVCLGTCCVCVSVPIRRFRGAFASELKIWSQSAVTVAPGLPPRRAHTNTLSSAVWRVWKDTAVCVLIPGILSDFCSVLTLSESVYAGKVRYRFTHLMLEIHPSPAVSWRLLFSSVLHTAVVSSYISGYRLCSDAAHV